MSGNVDHNLNAIIVQPSQAKPSMDTWLSSLPNVQTASHLVYNPALTVLSDGRVLGHIRPVKADGLWPWQPPSGLGPRNKDIWCRRQLAVRVLLLRENPSFKLVHPDLNWGDIFNVAAGSPPPVNQLAQVLLRITDKTELSPVHTGPRPRLERA